VQSRRERTSSGLCFFLDPSLDSFELSTDSSTLSQQNTKALYGASFLTFSGALPNGPLFLSLAAANAGSPTERAIAAAIVPSFGSMGSIASTWLYLPAFKPRYIPVSFARFFDSSHDALWQSNRRLHHSTSSPVDSSSSSPLTDSIAARIRSSDPFSSIFQGNIVNLIAAFGAMSMGALLSTYGIYENRKRVAGKRDDRLEGKTEEEIAALGHRHPRYRLII